MEGAFSVRRVVVTIAAVAAALLVGTVGFRETLDEGWYDAFYRAVVTASLFGLDSRPEGRDAEALTLFLVVAGVAIFAYIGALIVEAITHGVVTGAIAERRRKRMIDHLRDHYIICGYGRVGRQVGDEFNESGADRVVEPYSTAGREMAKLVLKPQVAAFLDAVSATGGPDLRFEEIIVDGSSRQSGRSIKDLDVRSQTGALIIALRKRDGTFDTTPNPDVVIDEGDVMICVGTPGELLLLEEMFAPRESVAR